MTDRIKLICDHIMHHIAKVSAEAANPASLKFGRRVLMDTIRMQLDDIRHAEFDEALTRLITGHYLNPLGAYTVGIGRGKGIKKYDLSHFKLFQSITPEQLAAEQKQKETRAATQKQPATSSDIPRLGQSIPAKPAKQTLDEEISDIHQALDRLRNRLNTPTRQIQHLERKVQALDGIADALEGPLLKRLLSEIKTDLQEIAA